MTLWCIFLNCFDWPVCFCIFLLIISNSTSFGKSSNNFAIIMIIYAIFIMLSLWLFFFGSELTVGKACQILWSLEPARWGLSGLDQVIQPIESLSLWFLLQELRLYPVKQFSHLPTVCDPSKSWYSTKPKFWEKFKHWAGAYLLKVGSDRTVSTAVGPVNISILFGCFTSEPATSYLHQK